MGAAASGVQAQMRTEHEQNAAFPWWVRLLAKGLAVIGGFIAIFFAVIGLVSLNYLCLMASLFQL